MSSLDQLSGIPCDSGAGTTQISYGSGGAVTITCVTPSPTPSTSSPSPNPTNTSQASAQNLGDICSAAPITLEGTVSAGDSLWYAFTDPSGCAVSGPLSIIPNGNSGSIALYLYDQGSSTPLSSSPGSDLQIFSGTGGSYDVQVVLLSGGPIEYSLAITTS